MIKVYAPHGIFEYSTGQAYTYQVGSELDVLDSEGDIIASFDRGRWDHAEDIEEAAEPESTPRSWEYLNEIPLYVNVITDNDGDKWHRHPKEARWLYKNRVDSGVRDPENYGPYIEVIS